MHGMSRAKLKTMLYVSTIYIIMLTGAPQAISVHNHNNNIIQFGNNR